MPDKTQLRYRGLKVKDLAKDEKHEIDSLFRAAKSRGYSGKVTGNSRADSIMKVLRNYILKDIERGLQEVDDDKRYERQYAAGKHRSKAAALALKRARATDAGRSMNNYEMDNYLTGIKAQAQNQFDKRYPR